MIAGLFKSGTTEELTNIFATKLFPASRRLPLPCEISNYYTMEEGERPRKLQKLEHDEINGKTPTEDGEPVMSGALKNGDESAAEGDQPVDSKPPIKSPHNDPSGSDLLEKDENVTAEAVPMSKKQQKRILKMQKWEEQRDERKHKRREKRLQRNERKREQRQNGEVQEKARGPRHRGTVVPVTLVLDCGWDDLMNDRERISLASQLTRSYSDNARAPYRGHVVISSFNKLLKERFETVLRNTHKSWKNVRFMEEDFVHAAEQAKEWMKSPSGGEIAGALMKQGGEPLPEDGEIIYLSSDSPNTLTELKPHSTYIIGGLVDKNRHKGVCYQKATELGIKTAKLPIGDYLRMATRPVLATNHVIEIMVKWLELGDWAEAFIKVIPERKGGTLKTNNNDEEDIEQEDTDGDVAGDRLEETGRTDSGAPDSSDGKDDSEAGSAALGDVARGDP